MMAPHTTQSQTNVQISGQEDNMYNQSSLYTSYTVPIQQGHIPQSSVSVFFFLFFEII